MGTNIQRFSQKHLVLHEDGAGHFNHLLTQVLPNKVGGRDYVCAVT